MPTPEAILLLSHGHRPTIILAKEEDGEQIANIPLSLEQVGRFLCGYPVIVNPVGLVAKPQLPTDYSAVPAKVDVDGMHLHRLRENPEERRFAYAWRDMSRGSFLAYQLQPAKDHGTGRPPEVTDRDREVAATMIQWLGSPVGQGWLRDMGYTKDPNHEPPPYVEPKTHHRHDSTRR